MSKKVTKRVSKRTSKKVHRRPTKSAIKKSAVKSAAKNGQNHSLFKKDDSADGHRLQKILAANGFGSRRECEALIEQGRVEIDGQTARLGSKGNLLRNEIKVDGQRLKQTKPVYLALFKPKGFLCTNRDQQGRQRALDLVPPSLGHLFLVGRLDRDSEGLILLTNDGAFSEHITHPRYGVPKVYRVLAAGDVTQETVAQLRKGVYLADGFAKAENVVIKGHHKQSTILEMTLTEGMNREIRRLLAKLGHKVLMLLRVAVGPVKLGKLAPGEWRHLSKQEIEQLYAVKR